MDTEVIMTRTSITIDEKLLQEIKDTGCNMSGFISTALRFYLDTYYLAEKVARRNIIRELSGS